MDMNGYRMDKLSSLPPLSQM